jgi:uncharacterized protein (DUF608 family)
LEWRELLGKAAAAYTSKLWNGSFFRFDESPRGGDVIMADQLAGYWYRQLGSTAHAPLLDREKVEAALHLIFEYNVQKFSGGRQGKDIDISYYRLLFGFSLLYTDRVTFGWLVSAALL